MTKLIILDIHVREGHVGPLHTLSVVRQHYWVVRGHVTVRKVIRECRFCRHMMHNRKTVYGTASFS